MWPSTLTSRFLTISLPLDLLTRQGCSSPSLHWKFSTLQCMCQNDLLPGAPLQPPCLCWEPYPSLLATQQPNSCLSSPTHQGGLASSFCISHSLIQHRVPLLTARDLAGQKSERQKMLSCCLRCDTSSAARACPENLTPPSHSLGGP